MKLRCNTLGNGEGQSETNQLSEDRQDIRTDVGTFETRNIQEKQNIRSEIRSEIDFFQV